MVHLNTLSFYYYLGQNFKLLPPVGRSDRPACYQPEVRRCCRSDQENGDNHADSDDQFDHNDDNDDQLDHGGDNEKHDDHCGSGDAAGLIMKMVIIMLIMMISLITMVTMKNMMIIEDREMLQV